MLTKEQINKIKFVIRLCGDVNWDDDNRIASLEEKIVAQAEEISQVSRMSVEEVLAGLGQVCQNCPSRVLELKGTCEIFYPQEYQESAIGFMETYKEKCPLYKERLHTQRHSRPRQVWNRIRSNPKMRRNKSDRQRKRDIINR